jgi:hypothetical protein
VDLCQFGKDPDPRIRTTDPALFVRGRQEANKKYFFLSFLLITFEGTLKSFFQDMKS